MKSTLAYADFARYVAQYRRRRRAIAAINAVGMVLAIAMVVAIGAAVWVFARG